MNTLSKQAGVTRHASQRSWREDCRGAGGWGVGRGQSSWRDRTEKIYILSTGTRGAKPISFDPEPLSPHPPKRVERFCFPGRCSQEIPGCVLAPGTQIDARRGAHGRRKSMTTSDRRRRGSAAARAPTAHFGGGGVFEVAFLKGYVLEHPQPPTVHSGRGGLPLLRPKVVNTIWGVRAQFSVSVRVAGGGNKQGGGNGAAGRRVGGSAGRRIG